MRAELSIEQLKSLVALNEQGALVWVHTLGGHVREGKEAGSSFGGYRRVKLMDRNILVHRVVFALANGRWPVGDVDHINGDKSDNRPTNLREVTNIQNHQNRPSHRSGRLVGATFCKRSSRWKAQARIGGKKQFLGHFDSEEDAHAAYTDFLSANNISPIRA